MLYIHNGDKVAIALLVGSHTRCLSCVRPWILCQLVVCARGRSKWGAGRAGEKMGVRVGWDRINLLGRDQGSVARVQLPGAP